MLRPRHILLHHSLTKDSQTVSWQAIRKYHKEVLGFDDIGYHFGVERVNSDYEVLVGRGLDKIGAHCVQHKMNYRSIGICMIGNFDNSTVPTLQLYKTAELVKSLIQIFDIPIDNIKRHGDYAKYKSCPGNRFYLDEFKYIVDNTYVLMK